MLSNEMKKIILDFYRKENRDWVIADADESTVDDGYKEIIFSLYQDLGYKSQFEDFSESEKELLQLISSYAYSLVNEFKDVLKDVKLEKHIYKIVRYYAMNLDGSESCFFLESVLNAYEMVEVLATIQFKFEELIDDSLTIHTDHLIKIMENFYPIKHVTEQYQKYASQARVNRNEWEMITVFMVENPETKDEFPIYQIDEYEARDFCCGEKYKKLMQAELVESNHFIEAIKDNVYIYK